jgi:hypothetical protein
MFLGCLTQYFSYLTVKIFTVIRAYVGEAEKGEYGFGIEMQSTIDQ